VRLLYVTDRKAIGDERFARVLASLAGSREVSVSLRERDASDRETLDVAARSRSTLGPSIPLFLHRRLDLAVASGADGVQLPEDGVPLARARAAAPRGLRVGVSTHSPAAARAAIEAGADRVLLGPIFATPSKAAFGPPLSPRALDALPRLAEHGCEVFAIGGVDETRIDELAPWRDRITGVAAIRMVQEARDPRAVAEWIGAR
jgi:thiamine-phosphate pyrophosphorylase